MVRGPKFAFPGRKSHTTVNANPPRDGDDALWSNRPDQGQPSYSKAERLLGTTGLPHRPSSRTLNFQSQKPAYMSTDSLPAPMSSSMAAEDRFIATKRPGLSNRASSNALGSAFQEESRRSSRSSSVTRQLMPQTSNSTLHSHYDPQKSPLSISQQTSASAVRDRALRKGKPQVTVREDYEHVLRPSSRQTADGMMKQSRKEKPARLDLSKLFPKPRSNGAGQYTGPLLSPNKLVNSPSAMSSASDYFPRPMTREPTPVPTNNPNTRAPVKLRKAPKRQQPSSQSTHSPTRLYKPDIYDNAKINVRRPPRGIEHWFDGLSDETDEDQEEQSHMPHAPPKNPNSAQLAPARKSSLGHSNYDAAPQAQGTVRGHRRERAPKQQLYLNSHTITSQSLKSPSQFSESQASLATTRTKESVFSKSNLQNSSVLSISSSEDEGEDDYQDKSITTKTRHISDSVESLNCREEIIIGKAQAYDIRPIPPNRRPSDSKLSMLTTSTNAATIEVMYTPEPYAPQTFPRPYGSRRSSHVRQPSVIPEDEDVRPKTSRHRPMSPTASVQSSRTSLSEPRSRTDGQKLMAVTEEEEALLELMRKKRAAMAKQSFTEGYKTAISREARENSPPPDTKRYRTSGFLTNETPSGSPARAATTAPGKMSTSASPLLQPPRRGKPKQNPHDLSLATSVLRDSSSCDDASVNRASPSPDPMRHHQLSPTPVFSPIDMFPSRTATPTELSVASPTTTDHPSPLPSPVTPGLRNGEPDVDVRVAGSEPSCNGDSEEVAVLDSGVIDAPSGSMPKPVSGKHDAERLGHFRRRTASSGADVAIPKAPAPSAHSHPNFDAFANRGQYDPPLASVSQTSSRSRAPSIIEPRLPRKSSKRSMASGLKLNTGVPLTRNGSLYSRTESPAGMGPLDRRSSRATRTSRASNGSLRDGAAKRSSGTRCSVSEDVLAAWGSLGGWRDIEGRGVAAGW